MRFVDQALFIGDGDLHDKKHDGTKSTVLVLSSTGEVPTLTSGYCEYSISLYFSDEFKTDERSNLAILCATVVAIIFSVMAGAFFMYDRFVQRRNTKIISAAANSNAFLSTLFPTEIKKRLLEDTDTDEHKIIAPKQGNVPSFFLHDDDMNDNGSPIAFKSKPIADLFTETTILFADVAGFSAWSSVREPSQVFILLETLFYAFDEIAKNRRVFKVSYRTLSDVILALWHSSLKFLHNFQQVETVGDCYVACAGLPDARSDHAVVMARFAQECMSRMQALTDKLEVTFGPDTGELSLRMGLHSGPVTAGVLRGDRSRFQLFGDTMNIAARMESLGIRNQIHMSQETADLLVAAGKTKWVSKREDGKTFTTSIVDILDRTISKKNVSFACSYLH